MTMSASLNDKPAVKMTGKTYASDGELVRLLCTDRANSGNEKPVVGIIISTGELRSWFLDGSYQGDVGPHKYDLVEVSPYHDWKIDEKVWYLSTSLLDQGQQRWRAGHFAGVDEEGRPTVWDTGRTSHTGLETWGRLVEIRRASEFTPQPWARLYPQAGETR
jgi:hypothetical protein